MFCKIDYIWLNFLNVGSMEERWNDKYGLNMKFVIHDDAMKRGGVDKGEIAWWNK